METKLIALYLLICRLYDTQPVLKQQRLSNNHQPLFSDEELLTMYVFGHLQGHTTQRRIYDYMRNHWREWFPALPAYQSVNHRLNELAPAFELLIERLLVGEAWHIRATDDRLIDSVPVMLARGTRANRARVAADLANTGFCATKQQHYRGVKLHFIAARRCEKLPLPEKIHLSAASQHDLSALREMAPSLPAGVACSPIKPTFTLTPPPLAKSAAGFCWPLTSAIGTRRKQRCRRFTIALSRRCASRWKVCSTG